MFGQLKENIFYGFQEAKNNPDELKAKFNGYVSTLKASPSLKKLHETYELIEKASFDSETIAAEFINECLAELKNVDKNEIEKLIPLAVSKGVSLPSRIVAFDQLVFNENMNLKDKYDQKTMLIKQLTKSNEKKVDYKEMINTLDKKVNNKVGKLTNEQKEALDVFIENNESKIKTYYGSLIESTIDSIENRLINEDSIDINKSLIASKKKLQSLKDKNPTIDTVDSIIELKNDLNA